MEDRVARERSYRVAALALQITERWDVTHYHAAHIRPYWASSLTEVARIGNHIFYK
jgi:spore germination cell wall hydrolase CwlJ-like protein